MYFKIIRTVLLFVLAGASATFAELQAEDLDRNQVRAIVADLRRIHTPEGIEQDVKVDLGGVEQWINIRGRNRENPAILLLHGGPGMPQLPLVWSYQNPWEDYFTVINWEQRGTGKNAIHTDKNKLAATITLDQLVSDASELLDVLREKLDKEKIVVLGFSYGTRIGAELARLRPDAISAYVGVGQVWGDAEGTLYRDVLARARAAEDETAISALENLAPYPNPDRNPTLEEMVEVRIWTAKLNGNWYGKSDINLLYQLPSLSPDYSDEELSEWIAAEAWFAKSLENNHAWGHYRSEKTGERSSQLEMPTTPDPIDVPVVIMMGRYDLMTPYTAAQEFYELVEAPSKTFVTFERSAHFAMFSEPGRFLMELIENVMPYTEGTAEYEIDLVGPNY